MCFSRDARTSCDIPGVAFLDGSNASIDYSAKPAVGRGARVELNMKYWPAIALFAAVTTPAAAQTMPDPNQFLVFASQVAINVDQGRAALVWDRSAPALKAQIQKDRFVAQLAASKASRGAVVARAWQSVVRSVVRAVDVPTGQVPVVIVTFTSTTNKNISYNEVVTFSFGKDNLWHTYNYSN